MKRWIAGLLAWLMLVTGVPVMAEGDVPALLVTTEISEGETPAPEPELRQIAMPSAMTLGVKQTLPLRADGQIRYTSADKKIATVDSKGNVKGIAPGQTEILAESEGATAVCTVRVIAAPKQVKLSFKSVKLGVGETSEAFAVDLGGDFAGGYTVASSNGKVATVEDQKITAHKTGSAKITVKAYNGKTAQIAVTVVKAPKHIALKTDTPVMAVGQTGSVKVQFNKGEGGGGTFESQDESILSVDANGNVAAVGVGTAEIVAKSYNGIEASCTIEVKPAPEGIAFAEESVTLGKGQSYTLKAESTNDSVPKIQYSTSNAKIATVDSQGKLKAVAPGEAVITAESYNGRTATCNVKVIAAPKQVKLRFKSIRLGVGETSEAFAVDLGGDFAGGYTVASSNGKVATVEEQKITAHKTGSAKITVKAYNGKSAQIAVTVVKAPKRIALKTDTPVMAVGQTGSVKVQFNKGEGGGGTFESQDESILTVDADGNVAAVSVGIAEIVARSYNGIEASCTIEVKPAPEGIAFAEDAVTLGKGQTSYVLKAESTNDSVPKIQYSTSNAKVVSVDSQGKLKAVTPGEAMITAESYNGRTATCNVKVIAAPKQVKLSVKSVKLGVGEKSEAFAVDLGGDFAGGYTITSSNGKVATVEDQRITAHKAGSAVVTVKAYNGKTAKITVTVVKAPTGIRIAADAGLLLSGESGAAKVSFNKGESGSVRYHSSDETVLNVHPDGSYTAVGVGTAQLIATTYNGCSAECSVRVAEPPAQMDSLEPLLLGVGEGRALGAQIWQASGEAYDGPLRVEFSATGIVTYDDGWLTAKKSGTVTATVIAGGLREEFVITVKPYHEVYSVQAVAHRGGKGYWEENTLEAFRNVAGTGAEWVELDVHTTLDGVQVVHHDASFKVGKVEYWIAEHTMEELRAQKPQLCTLAEALEVLAPQDLKIMLELKEGANGTACVEMIEEYSLTERMMYISFYVNRLEEVRAADAGAELGFLYSKGNPLPDDYMEMIRRLNITVIMPQANIIRDSDVAMWHSLGLKVSTGTYNTVKEIAKLIKLGIDFLCSDLPDLVVKNR